MYTVGDPFPDFKLQACVNTEPGQEFEEITNQSYPGNWKVVFFWPMDFTFVCPTEIAEFGLKNAEFAKHDAQVLGASTDTQYVHLAWRNDHPDLRELPVPMLADTKRELSTALGILDKEEDRLFMVHNHDAVFMQLSFRRNALEDKPFSI